MKNILRTLAVSIILVSSLAVFAAKPAQTWNTPMAAAKHDTNITLNMRKYLRQGFTVVDEYENAYRYFAPPEGDYLWGECVFNLKHEAGDYSLQVTHVQMTAYIDYINTADGYKCSGFDLIEETVY